MRRVLTALSLSLLLLCSCKRAGALLPDDVLRRATAASAQLQSVQYDATVGLVLQTATVSAQADAALHGTLARGGQETAFSLTMNASMLRLDPSHMIRPAPLAARLGDDLGEGRNPAQGVETVVLTADVVSELQDTYVLVHSLRADPASPALGNVETMLGKWWKIPRESGAFPMQQLSPDPRFLRAQAAVVTVLEDHGLERINGRDAYRYTVSINPDKLIELMKTISEQRGEPLDAAQVRSDLAQYDATGELWIDAETFVIHRLSWMVTSKATPENAANALRLRFGAELAAHNAAAPITMPVDAKVFHPEILIQRILAIPFGSGAVVTIP